MSLAAPTVAAETSQTTERRLVSVLFLDLVGSTALAEQHDPEDMRTLLDRYFESAQTVVDRHGGVVEKFIGDAVMAVWGTPVTREDDAERAVRAGLELIDAVAALRGLTDVALEARCGILTGEAATTQGVDHQGMVAGDLVNTAARLQSAAEPGWVLVGDATYRAASVAVAFEPAGEMRLKGKSEPVRVWRARRVVAERQGQNRMTIEPPFVGRAEELRLLKDLLHATGREGKARVVSVTGIGGIGKSRLTWEIQKYVDGLTEPIWWHRGRCPSYGDGITFWALGEMVRMRAGIAESDPAGVSRQKLSDSVAEHVADEDERRWLEPRLAFLLGLADRPAGGGDELFAAWRTFFERISDGGTVAMVFEDLQWADAGLLDFIESLLEWSRGKPIYVLTLARPELADSRPSWGSGVRSLLSLHLEPLADADMAELVRAMVPDADDAAVDRIVERSEGVPLYAVETIRMLVDRGVLQAGGDTYQLAGKLGQLDVPETLHALIASRLDGLGPDDRALLQDAAVLGKSFTLPALSAVTGSEPTSLEPRLVDLMHREFLTREADPRSPERGQFAFMQGIIQEIAYSMLSRADRRSRHLAVAHHFEEARDDELAEAVAAHYVAALEATPDGPNRDALSARARDWLTQAAARAAELGSPEQALILGEQALTITPAGRERAAILQKASRAAVDALRPEQSIAYLQEAADLLHDVGDLEAEIAALGLLASALGDDDRVEDLRAVTEEMRLRLGDTDDPLANAEYEHTSAYVAYFDNDIARALVCIDRALAGYEHAGAWERFHRALGNRSGALELLGRHRESITLRRGIVAVALEENDLRTAANVLVGLALQADELRESFELSMEAAALARRGGLGGAELAALGNAAEFSVETGEWAKADELLADLQARSGLPDNLADAVLLDRALLAAYRGDQDAARAAMSQITERTSKSANPTFLAWYLRVQCVLSLFAGDLQEAFESGIGAVEAEAVEGPNTVVAASYAGRAALWMGDIDRARRALELMPALPEGWNRAVHRALEAGVDALEGRTRDASAAFESTLAGRLAVGDQFTHALFALDAAAVLPDDAVPDGALATAAAYLSDLGANALLARLPDARAATRAAEV
jgi:class 3 adenylate cyclase